MASLQAALLSLALCSSGETVLLDFYADWCGPCRAMDPTVQALKTKGYPVRKVNIDRHPALARRYQVKQIPCFVMIVDGREVDRVVGSAALARLEAMCRRGASGRKQLAGNETPRPSPSQPQRGGRLKNLLGGSQRGAPGRDWQTSGPAWTPRQPSPGRDTQPVAQAQTTPPVQPVQQASHQQPAAAQPSPPSSASPGGLPERDPPDAGAESRRLIASSVRLRIDDPHGHSCGSGTIIDAREGEALILTCGHIFRDSKGQARVEVDLFGPTPAQGVPGRVVDYDLESDVGLIVVRPPGPVRTAPIAPPGQRLRPGQAVVSVGCDEGEDPTARPSRITSLNKYLGPDNLQVAGQPVEGRSGGGLFSADGHLIGVCNAADPQDREGLYAGLECLHAMLDDAGLAFVYQSQPPAGQVASQADTTPETPARSNPATAPLESSPQDEAGPGRFHAPLVRVDGPGASGGSAAAGQGAAGADRDPAAPERLANRGDRLPPLDPAEQAPLDEISRRLDEGAEVICIIRSRNDPKAESEVLVLDRVSSGFLEHLAERVRRQGGPTPTSQRR